MISSIFPKVVELKISSAADLLSEFQSAPERIFYVYVTCNPAADFEDMRPQAQNYSEAPPSTQCRKFAIGLALRYVTAIAHVWRRNFFLPFIRKNVCILAWNQSRAAGVKAVVLKSEIKHAKPSHCTKLFCSSKKQFKCCNKYLEFYRQQPTAKQCSKQYKLF
ncbi:hypothetical protein AVEN_54835-1 [Araneus ventricosus]|uniref:Uncharacterized protein n=1 Tax=Araneus ventricosus TaxID=182803 RepID=A0A4Y2EWV1_ARAVE|nr:hypothetical protein AVEN_54835-1 [Araneus ventricosus]